MDATFFKRSAEIFAMQRDSWWEYARFRRTIDDSYMAFLELVERTEKDMELEEKNKENQ